MQYLKQKNYQFFLLSSFNRKSSTLTINENMKKKEALKDQKENKENDETIEDFDEEKINYKYHVKDLISINEEV